MLTNPSKIQKKSLILVRGIPGASKTKFVELMATSKETIISIDQYFEDQYGNYNFDRARIKDAHKFCKDKTLAKMNLGISKLFITNPFIQEWEMDDYYKLAHNFGYDVYTIIIENRQQNKNIYDISEEKIEIMKQNFNIKL